MMKKRIRHALVTLAGALLLFSCGNGPETEAPAARAAKIPLPRLEPDRPYPVVEEKGIPIVRPDGPDHLKLYVNVVRPDAGGRFPALLIATAYRREFVRMLAPDSLVAAGYAVVISERSSVDSLWRAVVYQSDRFF